MWQENNRTEDTAGILREREWWGNVRRQFRSGLQLGLSCLVSGDWRLAPHLMISVYLFLIVAGINQQPGRAGWGHRNLKRMSGFTRTLGCLGERSQLLASTTSFTSWMPFIFPILNIEMSATISTIHREPETQWNQLSSWINSHYAPIIKALW